MAKRKRNQRIDAVPSTSSRALKTNGIKKVRLSPASDYSNRSNKPEKPATLSPPSINTDVLQHSNTAEHPQLVNDVLKTASSHTSVNIQIVTGSYERILHGITAELVISDEGVVKVEYSDSFLMNAHSSAIRCLALSPMPSDASEGVILATGGSDERVNVYSLSASPLPEQDSKGRKVPSMPTLGPNKVAENPANRELGTLVQHTANITALNFPSRSKLLAASEDNTVSITRLRDLQVVSMIKAPKPKISGQASGDSAAAGTTPSGINDFAVHPSMKLMVSVSQGERTMRLWNLVTGKKAGVLNFERDLLQAVKEGKYSHGEGRRIRWNRDGTEFAISFERGVIIFGEDAKARSVMLPQPLTKIHQIGFFMVAPGHEFLAVSTENGRIYFYSTSKATESSSDLLTLQPQGYTGGTAKGIKSRIKDFTVLDLSRYGFAGSAIVVACSNGNVSIITMLHQQLLGPPANDGSVGTVSTPYTTGNRITCVEAFIMMPAYDIDGGLSEAESVLGSDIVTDDEEESS